MKHDQSFFLIYGVGFLMMAMLSIALLLTLVHTHNIAVEYCDLTNDLVGLANREVEVINFQSQVLKYYSPEFEPSIITIVLNQTKCPRVITLGGWRI